jgi:hypothetical protein
MVKSSTFFIQNYNTLWDSLSDSQRKQLTDLIK